MKPGDLVLVKADAWKGKRKIKDRWEEETWEVVHQIVADIPSFFLLHQRLVFPCVWATIIHGTGVPVPPHARLPPLEVMKRRCHKRKMTRQPPNDLPVKLPGVEKWEVVAWTMDVHWSIH